MAVARVLIQVVIAIQGQAGGVVVNPAGIKIKLLYRSQGNRAARKKTRCFQTAITWVIQKLVTPCFNPALQRNLRREGWRSWRTPLNSFDSRNPLECRRSLVRIMR